jgi:hypothetical protein
VADRHHVDDDLALESECGSEVLKLLPQDAYGARRGATPSVTIIYAAR